MKTLTDRIRATRALWRLLGRLERDSRERDVTTSVTLVVEGDAAWQKLADEASLRGLPPPPRRRGWEVNYWPDVREPATARRGCSMAEALERVLSDR